MNNIYTVGDSHCFYGWGETNTKNIHLGSVLCYSFGQEKLNRFDIRSHDIKNGDTIIFCFGEIDCRCHIHKYIEDSSYQTIIDNIVNNYFEAISYVINESNILFKNICVFNITPPVEKATIVENQSFPHLGSDEERKNYVLYFNKKLKEKCAKYNYIFFDVYKEYSTENGYLNKDLSCGTVHIGNGIHINNFIKKHLLPQDS